jgi:hypothetical protein
MNARMDAAGPVDAKNAPTGPWKTAHPAVFTASTRILVFMVKTRPRPHTQNF